MAALPAWVDDPHRPPVLVLLVLSQNNNEGRLRRAALLKAWAGARQHRLMRTFFLYGGKRSAEEEGLARGKDGAEELHVAAIEGLRTIAIKVLRAIRWLYHGDGKAPPLNPPFVGKTDDDTFICVSSLLESTITIQPTISSSSFRRAACRCFR